MTRRTRQPEVEPTGLDGWVVLKPGEKMAWVNDTPVSPTPAQQHDTMRRIRGGILSHGFSIEEAIVTLILVKNYGTLDPRIGGDAFRAKARELRRDTGLERKIGEARPIIRDVLDSTTADRLMQDLAEYRRLRHLMAHRPCWLEGVWNDQAGTWTDTPKGRTTGFRLFIADDDFVWEIDDAQLKEWDALLARCQSSVERVRASFLPTPPPNK